MPDVALVVRTAAPDDADAIAALANEVQALHAAAHPALFKPAGPEVFPPGRIRALMAEEGQQFWVATMADAVVGYAYGFAQPVHDSPWHHIRSVFSIEQVGVAAPWRGHGIGSRLLAEVRAFAVARGVEELRLSVWTFNVEARGMYARHGFTTYQERMRLPLDEMEGDA